MVLFTAPIGTDLTISVDDLNRLLDDADKITTPADIREINIRSFGDFHTYLAGLNGNFGSIFLPNVDSPLPLDRSFEHSSKMFSKPVSLICYRGRITFGDVQVNYLFVVLGDPNGSRAIFSGLDEHPRNAKCVGKDLLDDAAPKIVPTNHQLSVVGLAMIAFHPTEFGLYQLLNDREIPLRDKIIATCLFLYPYAITTVKRYMQVIEYRGREIDIDEEPETTFTALGYPRSEDRLAALGLMVLGPAYSQQEKIGEQVSNRLKAAAVSLRTEAPDAHKLGAMVVKFGWKSNETPPTVADVLGAVVTVNREGIHDQKHKIDQIATVTELEAITPLTVVAKELLTQARMIYQNYHATSIRFIPPLLPMLTSVGGDKLPQFIKESEKFNAIATDLDTQHYIGLGDKLPEAYHITNFPMLAYMGIMYYAKHLTTLEERENFKKYKTAEIRNHIQSMTQQQHADIMIDCIPGPAAPMLFELQKAITFEQAQVIMSRVDETTIKQVILLGRQVRDAGPWVSAKIAEEDGARLVVMATQAVELAKKYINGRKERASALLEELEDPEQRKEYRKRVNIWINRMEDKVEAMIQWQRHIPMALTESQRADRDGLIATSQEMRAIGALMPTLQ